MPFVTFLLAYLLGSIPFGLLLGFLAGKDVRQAGSQNIGATNVWRVCGRNWGIAAFLLDFLKGLGALLLIARFFPAGLAVPYPGIIAAMGAVLGHNFPLWLGFKGGKGVATSAGVIAGLMLLPFLVAIGVFILTVAISRYISLGSMVSSLALVVATFFLVPQSLSDNLLLLLLTVAMCAMILFRHRQNLLRIIAGTENKFPPPKDAGKSNAV